MSQMACRCGGTIRDTSIPCPTEGWILRDQEQEAFIEGAGEDISAFFAAVRAGRRDDWIGRYFNPQYPLDTSDDGVVADIIDVHKRLVFLSVAECATCGRLWVQQAPGDNSYRSYTPDEPGYAEALRGSRPSVP